MVLLLRQFLAMNQASLHSASKIIICLSPFTETEVVVLSSPSSLIKITVISMRLLVSSETCQT